MRRALLLLTSAAVLATAVASGASATTSSAPRGVLTKVEYRELYASYQAMKHVGKQRGTLPQIVRRTCRALTNASRLTAAEHAECGASLIYSYEFFAFPYQAAQCAKDSDVARRNRCLLTAATAFQESVRAFIRTNAVSARAAAPRHFTKRCLSYLLFTPQQARATAALSAGLRHYARAVRSGNAGAITAAGSRLNGDLVNQRQAMSLNISVTACRHQ